MVSLGVTLGLIAGGVVFSWVRTRNLPDAKGGRVMLSAVVSKSANSDVASTVARTLVWYPTGRHWFAAIEEAIRCATSSIVAEFYIWSPGQLAQRLESLLAEAVERGLQRAAADRRLR